MSLRLRALWDHSRRVVTIVTTLCVLNVLTFVVTISYGLATATIKPASPPSTGCSFIPSFRHQYISFITAIVFETIVIALTVIRVWSISCDQHLRLPLLDILMQDGIIYYISANSINFIVLFTGLYADFTIALAIFGSLPAVAVAGVACNRMLLRLQSVLLASNIFASDIPLTAIDVSARIGADTAAVTTDIEVWDSISG
jgi:hypothetical protein